ncbi:hypothetical protein KY290_036995 [Solanum tuberosum]|uniref:Retrotransposon Copia-like N-terminal domain-containing protein n=1 Tax=Solanum tuberosum TaxID=4113 RepID=A0ABQ7TY27_SOLTU|nr:hypothetical protein KY290_036995 [Solanum tuberosum]
MESHSHDILSTKFDGKNYPMWEFHFRIFVQGENLFGILDGSTTKPNEDKEKQVWHANSARVMSWILNSASVQLGSRDVKASQKEYKQGDKDIQSYYSGLMAIWSEQDQSFGGNLSSTGIK